MKENKIKKIATIVVTYNRKELLTQCLDSLLSQTTKISKIFVIDNASTDGTEIYLEEKGYVKKEEIDYTRLSENIGGAGGFHHGLKKAFDEGYDWFWLMDDDAKLKENALEVLMDKTSEYEALTVSVRMWSDENVYDQRVLGAVQSTSLDFWNKEIKIDDFEKKVLPIYGYPLLGILISRKIVEDIGYPNPEFFIQSDDIDFTLRISSKYPMVLIRDSILLHYSNPTNITEEINFMGRKWRFLKIDQLWKDYYGIRNYIYLLKNNNGFFNMSFYILKRFPKEIFKWILCGKDRYYVLSLYTIALLDGIRENLGKRKEYLPGEYLKNN